MNISRNEQRALHVLALGGRILHKREDGPKISSVTCVTREGMILSDLDMTIFNKLRRKRLIESRSGGPYHISKRGRLSVRAQLHNSTIREHDMLIRNEIDSDATAIRRVVTEAMKVLPQATGTEAAIVDRLRANNALSLSLVAEDGGAVVGYLAASDARIGDVTGWGLIGPVAVLPSRHGQGIGSALMAEAIRRLRAGCKGAALVGDPDYYGRFGFRAFPSLRLGDVPPRFVQALPFHGSQPDGELIQHPAFGLEQKG